MHKAERKDVALVGGRGSGKYAVLENPRIEKGMKQICKDYPQIEVLDSEDNPIFSIVKSPRLYFPDDSLWLNFGEEKSGKKEPEEKKRVIDSKTGKFMKAYEQSGGNILILHNDFNVL
ncbi:hypothetical protein RFI_38001 [Reticulomyxa filosa]|uniref:Uncharacterized protein n=1 Tax=Reticulomyxa filosa TaxID=46433 RepID=X6LD59_RETFI|nr:hypothetical protein RFI_38001 [Reticulomyxa filosa]|eukprot:ETN99473.1 hypothetical protein RFI_38001 [Reticulomyxa filosa]